MSKRTGKVLKCEQCGNDFYASGWQLRERGTRQPKYCSRECKHAALRGNQPPWAKPDETTTHSAGYVLAWCPEHPRASHGRVFEHILVAEQMLGRYLIADEFVHHRDRNKKNNDPDNLLVLTSSEHAKLHAQESPVESTKVEMQCGECGAAFYAYRSRANANTPSLRRKYCSLACRHKSWGRQMAAIRKRR